MCLWPSNDGPIESLKGGVMKREGLFVVLTFCLLVVMTMYANCGMHIKPDVAKANNSQNTVTIEGTLHPRLTESWSQPTQAAQIIKPEVVFIVDYSGSVSGWSNNFLNSLTGWMGQLQNAGIDDICMGVMKSGVHQGIAGVLQAPASNKKCYCTFGIHAVSHNNLVSKFIENFNHAWTNISGGTNEEAAIFSLHKALNDPTVLQGNQVDGCFSHETTLIPIFVSDEADASVSWDANGNDVYDNTKYLPSGLNFSNSPTNLYYNNQNTSTGRRLHHATDSAGNVNTNAAGEIKNLIDFETVAQDLISFNGSFPSFGSAIGHIQGTNRATYWGGMQFANHFGKPMLDLNNAIITTQAAQFQSEMTTMATDIAIGIAYFHQFNLSHPICDANQNNNFSDEDLDVSVDGLQVSLADFTIAPDGTKITLDPSITFNPGSVTEITYSPCAP